MSFVDHTAKPMFAVSAYKALASEFAGNLRLLAANARHAPTFAKETSAFSPRRIKSAQLPAIDLCQSSIFRELRSREECQARVKLANADARSSLFGLKKCLGQLFAPQTQRLH